MVGVPEENIVVITGPCHAEEIALSVEFFDGIAIEKAVAARVAGVLKNHYMANLSMDIYGTEYGP